MNIILGLFKLIFFIIWTPIKLVFMIIGAIGANAEKWAKSAASSQEFRENVAPIMQTAETVKDEFLNVTKIKTKDAEQKPEQTSAGKGSFFIVRAINGKATVVPIAVVEVRGTLVKTADPALGYINESEILYTEKDAQDIAAHTAPEILMAKARMCTGPLMQEMWNNIPEGMRISV